MTVVLPCLISSVESEPSVPGASTLNVNVYTPAIPELVEGSAGEPLTSIVPRMRQ